MRSRLKLLLRAQWLIPADPIVLTATNDAAFRENSRRLMALPDKARVYAAEVPGWFDATSLPTEPALSLKVGAKLRFLRIDADKRWINGSWGIVTALAPEGPRVQLEDATEHEVGRAACENLVYPYDREAKQLTRE